MKKPEKDLKSIKKSAEYPQNLVNAVKMEIEILNRGSRWNAVPDVQDNDILQAYSSPFLDRPDDRCRKVLTWYFKDNMTYAEIGERMNLTGSRVSQLINESLRNIRDVLRARKIRYDNIEKAQKRMEHLCNSPSLLETEDNGSYRRWRYPKSGGKITLLAEYDYNTHMLTICDRGFSLNIR